MSVGSPILLLLALLAAGTFVAVAGSRRVQLLLSTAVFLLLASVADIRVRFSKPLDVLVLIDASQSTRGAWYREMTQARSAAEAAAPDATLRFARFANGVALPIADHDGLVPDISSWQTTLPTPDADAILLFSDGHLDSESAGIPVFPIVTRSRSSTNDARIESVTIEAGRHVVRMINDGVERRLIWPDGTRTAIPTGTSRAASSVGTPSGIVSLDGGDDWAENDRVTIASLPPAFASEQWWIGSDPPAGFRAMLPTDLLWRSDWLAARVIVLNNVSASDVSADGRRALVRYVRDLGGGLVMVGGDQAFSAGGYGNTELDALSPLASEAGSTIPRVILIDSSGSMAARIADGRTRFEVAVAAATAAAKQMPAVPIAFGSFGRETIWWPAPGTDRQPIVPHDLSPGGPTNLRAALDALIARTHGPTRVLLISDGQADLGDETTLIRELRRNLLTIDWLSLAESSAEASLAKVAQATDGIIMQAGEPTLWADRAEAAARQADRLAVSDAAYSIAWLDGSDVSVARQLNNVVERDTVERLAVHADDPRRAVVARWQVGVGKVASIAFAAPIDVTARLAETVAASPRDPRFTVHWLDDRVRVDAFEVDGTPMKNLPLQVYQAGISPMKQIAPGRYEVDLKPLAEPSAPRVLLDGRTIDATTLPGLFPKEFAAIGEDRDALSALARRSGGQLLQAGERMPLVVSSRKSIDGFLIGASAVATTAALVLSRIGGSRRSIYTASRES